jgi:hypothetical protein
MAVLSDRKREAPKCMPGASEKGLERRVRAVPGWLAQHFGSFGAPLISLHAKIYHGADTAAVARGARLNKEKPRASGGATGHGRAKLQLNLLLDPYRAQHYSIVAVAPRLVVIVVSIPSWPVISLAVLPITPRLRVALIPIAVSRSMFFVPTTWLAAVASWLIAVRARVVARTS